MKSVSETLLVRAEGYEKKALVSTPIMAGLLRAKAQILLQQSIDIVSVGDYYVDVCDENDWVSPKSDDELAFEDYQCELSCWRENDCYFSSSGHAPSFEAWKGGW